MNPSRVGARRPWIGAALVAVGAGMVAASFLPVLGRAAGRTREDAVRYQQAADRLHELTGLAAASGHEPERRRELLDAQAEFAAERAKLDAARGRGPALRDWLRLAGAVLVGVGLMVRAIPGQPAAA